MPTAWVASLVKGGDALAHLACIPGLCVTRGMKAKHVGCGERPGKGLGGMHCSGPNHLGPRAPHGWDWQLSRGKNNWEEGGRMESWLQAAPRWEWGSACRMEGPRGQNTPSVRLQVICGLAAFGAPIWMTSIMSTSVPVLGDH